MVRCLESTQLWYPKSFPPFLMRLCPTKNQYAESKLQYGTQKGSVEPLREPFINFFTHTIFKIFADPESARRDLSIDQIKKMSHIDPLPRTLLKPL